MAGYFDAPQAPQNAGYSDESPAPVSLGYSDDASPLGGYTTELSSTPPQSLGYSGGAPGVGGYTTELSTDAESLGYSEGAPADARAVPAAQPEAAPDAGLRTKDLPGIFNDEQKDASWFRGAPQGWNHRSRQQGTQFVGINTRYLDPKEQERATVKVEDGLLRDASGAIDTVGNSGVGTQHGLGAGKNLFAMTPGGDVRSMASWENHTETPVNPQAPEQKILSTVNHSSLAAVPNENGGMKGGAVAAAGELQVRDGKLEMLTDQSGHYKPDNQMTYQALEHFADEGVDMHDVTVKTTPKGPNGLKMDSEKRDEKYMYASAREFMSYGGAADAEAQIRARREAMRSDITAATREREQRGAGSFVDPREQRDQMYLASLKRSPEGPFVGMYGE